MKWSIAVEHTMQIRGFMDTVMKIRVPFHHLPNMGFLYNSKLIPSSYGRLLHHRYFKNKQLKIRCSGYMKRIDK